MQENNFSKNNFEQCIKCTICTAYCPVVPVNPLYPGPKQAGPDGERLRLKNAFFYDENLKYCLNCKRCEVACPSGVKIADIIHISRKTYSHHVPGLRDLLLANTDFMGKAVRPLAPLANAALKLPVTKALMHGLLGVDKHRTFPEYSRHGFREWFSRHAADLQETFPRKVAFFHGCSTQCQHPEVGVAFVKVLNALGYGVELMDEQCCGVAMISNGLWKAATKHAQHNKTAIKKAASDGKPVVTVSSSCTFTMRDEYTNILGVDMSGLKENITLVEKFIFTLLDQGAVRLAFRKNFHARVAYHAPCHVEKLGWGLFTRRLLGMIPGLELVELESNCCGIAGTYGFKKENYRAAQAIGKPLFDNIAAVKPDYVACECDTCKWQIEMSTGFRVLNPILILAEALDLDATAELNR